MPTTLHIRQRPLHAGKFPITLTLKREKQADLEAEAEIEFALTPQEQADLRWYMEDYLTLVAVTEAVQIEQIEATMKQRGEELYTKVLAANLNTQAIWFAVREGLADLRVEIASGIAEAAAIPWELMRDPQSDSAIALRVLAFVRIQSNPNISFVPVPPAEQGRLRLLYIVSRPRGANDVELRAVANRLLQDLGQNLARFEITALRPPTFEQLQATLKEAKAAGRPFHIVHFDGHGVYADLSQTILADWLKTLSLLTLGGQPNGKHGYLLFEHPESDEKMRPVSGTELGQLLHDNGVPVLVLNACQSAMHAAVADQQPAAEEAHDNVRAIGSLTQAVIDQGIPAVLGMRYSVFVVTAAQYIGQLYAALAQGRPFGQAASEGRKHLALNPERWIGLEPRPLQDWFVPVVYEALPMHLLPPKGSAPGLQLDQDAAVLDPVQNNRALRRYVPDTGFVGRDETLLLLDRAFDQRPVVLLHAYAGQGKSATAVEFARWYAQTGGLGPQPVVLLTSFETQTDLSDVLNQIGGYFDPLLKANGIEWHALNENARRSRLVLQILGQIPVLWIWDNVEPVAGFPAGSASAWTPDEQADLADFLKQIKLDRATRAKILLTSRRDEQAWLGGLPYRIEMPRMRNSDAANLARSLGSEGQIVRKDLADWQPLLDYCHGNPLTLRVIVGQALRQGLRGRAQIEHFVAAMRSGEQAIEDADEKQGRDKSLGASLAYGFRHAFSDDEQPIIALLHLFQGTVEVAALVLMGNGEHALPELQGKTQADLTGLLERARETGLLTGMGGAWYSIHPALPWFLRQLFVRHYDGAQNRSSATAALRAWVEAIGELSNYYWWQFEGGNREVIPFLALEEANLLHVRRSARRQSWWVGVLSAMQGLRVLYEYQGRAAEWARLVAETTPDFCAPADDPLPAGEAGGEPGRTDGYGLVMGYRVDLAQEYERDLPRAAALQEKCVAWDRQQAAPALALPAEAALDPGQRNRIRTLGAGVFTLGQILMEQASPDCVAAYEESIRHYQRIQDTAAEAIAHYNLGHAYKDIPALRDLEAAEAAYQRALGLYAPEDKLNQSGAIQQIGMVHHARFDAARQRGEPEETVLKHAQAAEGCYQQALALCPPSALAVLGPTHNGLGNLYDSVGQTERAREHYEKAAQLFEQTGDRYRAGVVRRNLALMYRQAAGRETAPACQRDLLRRAEAFAAAALRDFQHYQGRAAQDEAQAQRLLERIQEELAKLA